MFANFRGKFRRARDLVRFLYDRKMRGASPPKDVPWLDQEGLEAFEAELSKASSFLEYGSGGTTIVADRVGIPTVSVESDPYFAEAVRSAIRGRKVNLLNPKMGLTGYWGAPLFRRRAKSSRYIEAPYPCTPFPDFILIDGRYRVACALAAAKHAYEANRQATLMFDDYARRVNYHVIEKFLGKPKLIGRAAFFSIGSRAIDQSAIDAASGDWR